MGLYLYGGNGKMVLEVSVGYICRGYCVFIYKQLFVLQFFSYIVLQLVDLKIGL